jgi:hypothetical protein
LSVSLLACATTAFAQTARPERPYRGLFASGTESWTQSVVASGSLASGYDDNLLAGARGGNRGAGVVAGPNARGTFGQGSASLRYSFESEGLSIGASAASSVRYYPKGTTDKYTRSTSGQMNLSAQLRKGTSLSAQLAATQQPDTFAELFSVPDLDISFSEPALPELDTASALSYYLAFAGNVGITHNLSERTKIGGSYGLRTTSGRGDRGEFKKQRGDGHLTHQLGRGLSVRAGYSYSQGDYSNDHSVPNHVIDAGVNYNRSLSFSRRTTLSFGTGTTATRARDKLRYTLVGNARLNHEIGRSWLAQTGYSRRVLLHESWQEPVLANSVNAGLSGLISRRLQFTSSADAAFATVGEHTGGRNFDSYHGSAAITYAITRFLNAGVTYAYYRYRAADDVLLPEGFPRTFDRQSIRVTVNVWAPLFERGRRTNVTR